MFNCARGRRQNNSPNGARVVGTGAFGRVHFILQGVLRTHIYTFSTDMACIILKERHGTTLLLSLLTVGLSCDCQVRSRYLLVTIWRSAE